MELFRANVVSPIGTWGVEGDEKSVTRVFLPHEKARISRGTPPRAVAVGAQQLREYFNGERKSFVVPLADVAATPFQLYVWAALCDIPYGEVRTYGEIAAAVGRPKAAQAVGQANHVNPWPIIVPCHRVVNKHGLGGYGGGERVKRFLLDLEGVHYPEGSE
ncbi:MAG: methylated-DNA--[protein]-cysteine S-methyltransferase [Acidimicrobiales bacterium]